MCVCLLNPIFSTLDHHGVFLFKCDFNCFLWFLFVKRWTRCRTPSLHRLRMVCKKQEQYIFNMNSFGDKVGYKHKLSRLFDIFSFYPYGYGTPQMGQAPQFVGTVTVNTANPQKTIYAANMFKHQCFCCKCHFKFAIHEPIFLTLRTSLLRRSKRVGVQGVVALRVLETRVWDASCA